MKNEFLAFLREYDIVTLIVAFVMGTASTGLVNSVVKDILLPLAAPLSAAGSFDKAAITIGPVTLSYGSVIVELLNFIILAFLIFLIVRKLPKKSKQ